MSAADDTKAKPARPEGTSKPLARRRRPTLQGRSAEPVDAGEYGDDAIARLTGHKGSVVDRFDVQSGTVLRPGQDPTPQTVSIGRPTVTPVSSDDDQSDTAPTDGGGEATEAPAAEEAPTAAPAKDTVGQEPAAAEAPSKSTPGPRKRRSSTATPSTGSAEPSAAPVDAKPGATISVPPKVREWVDIEARTYQSTAAFVIETVAAIVGKGDLEKIYEANPLLPRVSTALGAPATQVRMRRDVPTETKRLRVPPAIKADLERLLGRPEYSLTARLSAVVTYAYQEQTGDDPFAKA